MNTTPKPHRTNRFRATTAQQPGLYPMASVLANHGRPVGCAKTRVVVGLIKPSQPPSADLGDGNTSGEVSK